jgi:hypothetical protein
MFNDVSKKIDFDIVDVDTFQKKKSLVKLYMV